MQNFQALGTPAAGDFAPRPPKQPPKLRISGYAPATLCTVYNHMGFRSFCFEQFFLRRSVANLMMLTIIDACLMPNCFLFEKFSLHYALCDFDSILLHCTKLFICQSIDREQIFKSLLKLLHWKILHTPLHVIRINRKLSFSIFLNNFACCVCYQNQPSVFFIQIWQLLQATRE